MREVRSENLDVLVDFNEACGLTSLATLSNDHSCPFCFDPSMSPIPRYFLTKSSLYGPGGPRSTMNCLGGWMVAVLPGWRYEDRTACWARYTLIPYTVRFGGGQCSVIPMSSADATMKAKVSETVEVSAKWDDGRG